MSSSAPATERPPAPRTPRRRRLWTALVVLVVLLALAAVLGPRLYARVESGKAAAPLAATGSVAPAAPTAAATDPALDGTWVVAGGTAGYRVDEVLNGQQITVTGRTERVGGNLTVAGGQLTAGTVSVDLASVATDSGQRDNQFRTRVVDVERFPTADFTLTRPVPLGGLDVGATVPVSLTGTMALHGTTREVTVPAMVERTGEDVVTVTGSLPLTWSDYGVQAPDLGFVSVEDAGTIEFAVSANPS